MQEGDVMSKLLRNGLPGIRVVRARLIAEFRSTSTWELELACGHTIARHKRWIGGHHTPRYAGCWQCHAARVETGAVQGD